MSGSAGPAGERTCTGVNTQFLSEIKPGDLIWFDSSVAVTTNPCRVYSVTSDTSLTIEDPGAVIVGRFLIIPSDFGQTTESEYKLNHHDKLVDTGARFSFQPLASGLLQSTKHVPLWATNGLEIEFTLASDSISLINRNKDSTSAGDVAETVDAKIEITEAFVHYTAAHYSPVVQAALEAKYIRDGINLIIPTFHVNKRTLTTGAGDVSEEFQESFAMLDTIYTVLRDFSSTGAAGEETGYQFMYNPSFAFEAANLTKYFVDYNRVKLPNWGDESDLKSEDLYLESRKGLNLLGDHRLDLQSYADFNIANSSHNSQIMITNFERFPEGHLSGVDTNTGRIKIRFTHDLTQNAELAVMFSYQQLITLKDGTPTLIQS